MAIKYEDVLTLAKAGFTASQIAAMVTTPSPAPVPAPAAVPAPDPLEQILTQLRINAVNQSQQPPVQTVDDILAEVINPPAKGGK